MAAAPTPLPTSEEGLVAAHGPYGPLHYHHQAGTSSRAAWHAEPYGAAFGVATTEEYVPHMMDQGHPREGKQGSLLSPSWGDEAPEAELF